MKWKNTNGIRRIPVVLCMLCMLLVSPAVSLTVNADSDAKLTASSTAAERGETVPVILYLQGNPGIWGLKLKVNYDHSALSLQSVTEGNIFEESDVVLPGNLSREQFVFVAASNNLEDITADGTMATLHFLVKDGAEAGDYPIDIEMTQAINLAGEDVKIGVEGGGVTVNVSDGSDPASDSHESELKETGANVMTTGAKTGDGSNPFLWTALTAAALAGAGACYMVHIRRGSKGR